MVIEQAQDYIVVSDDEVKAVKAFKGKFWVNKYAVDDYATFAVDVLDMGFKTKHFKTLKAAIAYGKKKTEMFVDGGNVMKALGY